MNNTDRYCSFSIRTDCPHCGNPLPLNGPLKAPVCSSCQQTVELPERVLHRAMVYYGEAFDAPGGTYGPSSELPSGFTIKHTICVEQPLCGRCGEALPVAEINTDTNGTMACPACGCPFDTYPTPAWCRQLFPELTQVFGGGRDQFTAAPGSGAPATRVPEAADEKPILLQCPQCSGSLSITGANARLTSCNFCGSEFYLPDAVWHRLHPVTTVQKWFVRVEGLTNNERARANRDARQLEEQRLAEEQGRFTLEQEAQAYSEAVSKSVEKASGAAWWTWLTVGSMLPALVIAIIFLFRFIGIPFILVFSVATAFSVISFFVGLSTFNRAVTDLVSYPPPNTELIAYLFVIPVVGIFTVIWVTRRLAADIGNALAMKGTPELEPLLVRPMIRHILLGIILINLLIPVSILTLIIRS